MADIKYNIYYSTNLRGPWTLANDTPLDHSDSQNQYEITGLTSGVTYYIHIVGGVINSDDEFVPLISQPIRPNGQGAADVEAAEAPAIITRTFLPTGGV